MVTQTYQNNMNNSVIVNNIEKTNALLSQILTCIKEQNALLEQIVVNTTPTP